MTDRLERTEAELSAAAKAAGAGDLYNTARDIDCAAAEGLANQKANVTISNWTARNREAGKRWACIACALLTVLFNLFPLAKTTKDHCDDALR